MENWRTPPTTPTNPSEDAAHDADLDARDEMSAGYYDEAELRYARRYRPGRGGFDPEAAAIIAKAKYAFRQRVVLAMLIGAVATAVAGAAVFPMAWWAHGVIDIVLVSYLVYLRRQVRIETEIRERRLARLQRVRRAQAAARQQQRPLEPAYEPELEPVAYEESFEEEYEPEEAAGPRERVSDGPYTARSSAPARSSWTSTTRTRHSRNWTNRARCPTAGRWVSSCYAHPASPGAVAQLVAHLVRIEGVRGSIPLSSTFQGRSCSVASPLSPGRPSLFCDA